MPHPGPLRHHSPQPIVEVARVVYNRASVATQVQESKQEVQKIKRYVDTVLFDLLEISP